ncbi:LAMI_0H02322g1_1 [Lachancea mirantina]|uniref:ATP-dependent RNA helicase SUV3, mitochondrial n=1 Tax=Lachancea mirantina TaxID=1230905 RepID=A0A1G4KDZ2_9SACH|nr:LAMI_0H02322g1_1 [Lachancea mirantina]
MLRRVSGGPLGYWFGVGRSRSFGSFAASSSKKKEEWPLGKPTFNHLSPSERTQINRTELSFPAKASNLYLQDREFKGVFDDTLQWVFDNKLKAFEKDASKAKQYAWLKLREHVYKQLRDRSLEEKIANYKVCLSEMLYPTRPDLLVPQLINCTKIPESQWKAILETNSVSSHTIFQHIVGKMFDFVYEQQILPVVTPVKSSTTSERDIDISNPAEWFPEARKWRRNIVMHIGPTNSGKTYKALQRLKQCGRGYYAGPLRLLAREVFERFKNEGIRCNLLTGEEVIEDLDEMGNPAGLTSGTIEMVPLSQKFDVVVLDEIQMMGDSDRGWAWTNALLGARAREIHVCGEKSTLPLIEKIVKMTGDRLIINEYERLGKLEVTDTALLNGFRDLKKGDCVIAFSKKKILDLKLKIESQTDLKVAVVYGSLPPETRIQQANKFNSGEYDVLVASDAVGMGLNLSIERVIFTTHLKFNGQEMVKLTSSNVKQIGGRAGRFRSLLNTTGAKSASIGLVTAVDPDVLTAVRQGIHSPIEYLRSATVWPPDEICGKLMTHSPAGTQVSTLLEALAQDVENRSAKLFQLSDLKNRLQNISLFEHIEGIPFFEKLRLSNAPVKDMPMVKSAFVQFCKTIAQRQTRSLLSYPFPFNILNLSCILDEKLTLEYYESLHNIIMLFFWLSNRYPHYFIDQTSAREMKNVCELIIFEKLDHLKRNPYAKRSQLSTTNFSRLLNKPIGQRGKMS